MGCDEVILIDTHVVIWLTKGDSKLGKQSRSLIDQGREDRRLLFSAISLWEISLLAAKDRLSLKQAPEELRHDLLIGGAIEAALSGDIAINAATLDMHGDPADRFIVATAMAHGATLVTADKALLTWRGKLARQDAAR